MRPKSSDGNAQRREKYLEQVRGFVERWGEHYSGRFAAQLARLEARESVEVSAWEIREGLPDDQTYVLEPNGALTVVSEARE